jgi:hypothetical protein
MSLQDKSSHNKVSYFRVLFYIGSILLCAYSYSNAIAAKDPRGKTDQEVNTFGKIVSLKGKAWIKHGPDPLAQVAAANNMIFLNGDTLITEPNSEVKLKLGNQEMALLIKEESQTTIKKTAPQKWLIEFDHGVLLTTIHPNAIVEKDFLQIKTPQSTIGVRSPAVFLKLEKGKPLFLCTCSGLTTLDNKVLIIGKEHNVPKWVESGNDPIGKRLKAAEKNSDHSDADIKALAKILD